jgi:hypothetical protein
MVDVGQRRPTGGLVQPEEPGNGYSDLMEQVRDALRHLYDYAHLQTHALTRFSQQDQDGDSWSAGQRLGRQLQAALAALQPEAAAAPSAANRRARLLHLRYLDEMEALAVQHSLSISRSTYQREHAIALRAVTSLLHTRWNVAGASAAHRQAAPAEVTAETAQHEPTFLTSFVGRERELAEVGRLLDRVRLVTLTGPPASKRCARRSTGVTTSWTPHNKPSFVASLSS